MMRLTSLDAVEDFNPALIAGEEPELCVRLRAKGWEVWRIDAEMVLHDSAMTRFSQFWKRMRRGGHAYAEGAAIHGAPPERHGVRGRNSAVFWGLIIPILVLIAALLIGLEAVILLTIYPLKISQIALRHGNDCIAWKRATFLVIGKFAESRGVTEYYFNACRGRRANLIEYK